MLFVQGVSADGNNTAITREYLQRKCLPIAGLLQGMALPEFTTLPENWPTVIVSVKPFHHCSCSCFGVVHLQSENH